MPSDHSKDPDFLRDLEGEIMGVFNIHPNKTFNYKQMAAQLHMQEKFDKAAIAEILQKLFGKGRLLEVEKGKFKLKPTRIYAEGIIEITASGAAYVMNDDFEEDIYIAPKNTKQALNGDKVKIYLYAKRRDRRIEGEVMEVLERAKNQFVGVVQISPKFAFLVPDSPNMLVDIFIPLNNLNGAEHGQKAIAEISEWPKTAKNPFGKITRVLGWPGENDAEIHAIIAEFGLPITFPEEVEEEAENIPEKIPAEEIKKRRDFRKVTTLTIDPVDAKDFDDALSLQKLENGNFEVGVHIADVTHYVVEESILDKEALERATSVYLVDRVIPMLPEKLSNVVCSLRPNEDKLCFSAVFELEPNGKLVNEWFGKTVIHSDKRFSYEDAQFVLDTREGHFYEELNILDSLAKNLRQLRFKNGAINFEKTEVKFKLDERGNPVGVYVKESRDTNKLIEEFMLLANKRVAEFVGKAKPGKEAKTFVYRIHDSPLPERLTNFSTFIAKFGYKLTFKSDKDIANSLNSLIKEVNGKKEQNVIENLAIRTMAKAIYSTENIGHYGLAFDYYSHFTSPIRRYPDVMVHRLLFHYLNGGKSAPAEDLELKCKHSTEKEIKAAEAERASIKYKQVQFLQDKIGEVFDGVISGVTEWGIYVELIDNKCEGMIRLREIADDFYEFDETNYAIKGVRTGNVYQLGDTVKVQLKRTDLLKKQIDFTLITDYGPTFEDEFGMNDVRWPESKNVKGPVNNRQKSGRGGYKGHKKR